MIEQKQNSSSKMSNQNNNLFEKYLQLRNQLVSKQSQKSLLESYEKIKKELQKIIKQNYQSFLQNWNNKEQYSQFQIDNRWTCLYNNNQTNQFTAQFICSSRSCLKRAVICNNNECQCLKKDHKKCLIIPIQIFIKNLQSKIRKPPSQTFYAYIQGKKVLLNFLLNLISKQRQTAQEWQNIFLSTNQQISQKTIQYYLYVFNGKVKNCKKIKSGLDQKTSQLHEYYELVQFKDKQQRQSKYGKFIKIINETYNLIIDSALKEIEKVQTAEIRSHYLNYAQYQILKHFMASNGSIDCGKNLQKITGNLVFIAKNLPLKKHIDQYTIKNTEKINQYEKEKNSQQIHLKMGFDQNLVISVQQSCKQFRLDKNTLMNLKNKWNQKCSKIFYRQIEGIVFQFDQLLKEKFDKTFFFNNQNLPELVQSKLEQIFLELQRKEIYKEKQYQSFQFSPDFINKDILKPYSKIHLQTNLQKVQINQRQKSQKIGLKITQSILQKFNENQLKYLTLYLYGIEKFPDGFIKKLCKKFPQIKQFHHSFLSNSQYLEKFSQNRTFIYSFYEFQLSIQQFLQLSNLKQLQNIFISQIDNKKSADIIKNMKKKSLKHVSLHKKSYSSQTICKQLFQELLQMKFQFVTLSLAYLQINKNQIKNIMNIIQNNPNIQTLILFNLRNSYKYIKSQFFYCIGKNLKNLKKLIIQNGYFNSNKIQQKDFQMFGQCSPSLKLLNLSRFRGIDQQIFKKAISKMKNITHLILIQNNFVNDDVMQIIGSSLLKLEMLNLSECKNVTGAGLLKLQNLKYLKTLIFYKNVQIIGKDMVQLSKQVKTIKKLQFSWMITQDNRDNFCQQDLLEINNNLNQGITHLSIRGCYKVNLNCIKSLNSLKLLWVSGDHFKDKERQELQRYAKIKKINLNQS